MVTEWEPLKKGKLMNFDNRVKWCKSINLIFNNEECITYRDVIYIHVSTKGDYLKQSK